MHRRLDVDKQLLSAYSSSTMNVPSLILSGIMFAAIPLQSAHAQNVVFGDPQQIIGTPLADAEAPQIATSGKNVYIIWHEERIPNSAKHDVYFARSTNGGATFDKEGTNLSITDADSSEERLVASGQNVFVVWSEDTNADGKNDSVYFRGSTNGGASFAKTKLLYTNSEGAEAPQIAASGKNVFVAWQATLGGISNIYVTQSSNAGGKFNNKADNISKSNNALFQAQVRQIGISGNDVIVTWRDDKSGDFETFFAHGE